MTDDAIAALITELKALKLREAHIINQLEAANERNRSHADNNATTDRNSTNTRADTNANDRNSTSTRADTNANVSDFLRSFVEGDRVIIANFVRKPVNWPSEVAWDEKVARRATVTKIDKAADRVYFITDNGISTWRMQSNLRRLRE